METIIKGVKETALALVNAAADRSPVKATDPFADKAMVRKNADGKVQGLRLSFVAEHPYAEVRKALKAAGKTGKALTAAVEGVLRGGTDMAWALHDAATSFARSNGFRPVLTDVNKAGDKMTTRFVKVPIVMSKELIVKELTVEELETALAERKAAKNGKAEGQPTIDAGTGELVK